MGVREDLTVIGRYTNGGRCQMQRCSSMVSYELARFDFVTKATSHISHHNGELVTMERRRSPIMYSHDVGFIHAKLCA